MPLVSTAAAAGLAGGSADLLQGAAFAIWTTTPWTIPANLAVAVNGVLDYAVVEVRVVAMFACGAEVDSRRGGGQGNAQWARGRQAAVKGQSCSCCD